MPQHCQDVKVEHIEGVVRITLCRPDAMNALSPAMLTAMRGAVAAAAEDDSVRCVVFTGQGRAFCAGADLSTIPKGDDSIRQFIAEASATMRDIEKLQKPVIASLNGTTLAGGLELALCADIVVASVSAQIGDGHINFGLLPGAGGSVRLARAIGPGRARFLLYSGLTMSASDLERWGLVQQVFDDDELPERTFDLAARLARHSPLVLQHLKQLVAQTASGDLDTLLAEELAANVVHSRSHDMREGLSAFAEKRKPVFLGR